MTSARFLNPDGSHRPVGYSHVAEVVSGRPVYIAGQVALDPSGKLVGEGDIVAQTRQVFENLKTALAAVGSGFGAVVKLNYYAVDASRLPEIRAVRDEYVNSATPPASTFVIVKSLVRPELLIEIEAVALVAE